jgi:hypothetical protein
MVVVAAVVYPKGPGTESRVSVSSSAYKDKPAAFDQPKNRCFANLGSIMLVTSRRP